jgi:CDP-paratose 2-epimerase
LAQKVVLVTGSCGLIGSEVSLFFSELDFRIVGIDNNLRAVFFGPEGDTSWVLSRLSEKICGYQHSTLDIRDRDALLCFVKEIRPDIIIHTAAQPSHDRAASIPFLDFETNALGTLHLLEAARQYCPEAPFIHMSTNKVYGDRPNEIPLQELDTRWDYGEPARSWWTTMVIIIFLLASLTDIERERGRVPSRRGLSLSPIMANQGGYLIAVGCSPCNSFR